MTNIRELEVGKRKVLIHEGNLHNEIKSLQAQLTQTQQALDSAFREAMEELAWLKKTAIDRSDYSRAVGYEECLMKFKSALKAIGE